MPGEKAYDQRGLEGPRPPGSVPWGEAHHRSRGGPGAGIARPERESTPEDSVIDAAVLLGRFLLLLLIPRYPLPAMLAGLVLYAVDQPVLKPITTLDPVGCRSHDQAVVVFCFSVAMVPIWILIRRPRDYWLHIANRI